jgi:hypothetical protein
MLLDLIGKTKQTYVLLVLAKCVYVITSFKLWIYKKAHDVFALVVDFLGENWKPKHVIIDFSNIRTSIGKKFAKPFKATWLDQKDPCFMLKMKVQIWLPWLLLWSE